MSRCTGVASGSATEDAGLPSRLCGGGIVVAVEPVQRCSGVNGRGVDVMVAAQENADLLDMLSDPSYEDPFTAMPLDPHRQEQHQQARRLQEDLVLHSGPPSATPTSAPTATTRGGFATTAAPSQAGRDGFTSSPTAVGEGSGTASPTSAGDGSRDGDTIDGTPAPASAGWKAAASGMGGLVVAMVGMWSGATVLLKRVL